MTAEAGVSKQTLYAYFPAKVDLLKAILDRELARLALEGPLPEPQTLPELRGLLVQFATRLTQTLLHPDSVALIRLVLGEAFRIPELRDTVRQAFPMRGLQGIAAIVGRADELGLIEACLLYTSCPLLASARRYPDVVCGIHQGLIDAISHEPQELLPFVAAGACLIRHA